MRHQTGIGHSTARRPYPQERKTIVIADDGNAASIVVLDGNQSPTTGCLIEHLGRSWVIRGQRHSSRVLVAEPLARVEQ